MLRALGSFILLGLLVALAALAFVRRDAWLPLVLPAADPTSTADDHDHDDPHDHDEHDHAADEHDHDHGAETDHAHDHEGDAVEVSPQARRNMGITSKTLRLRSGWRTITIPGTITERPGISDQGVTSPVVGVVTKIDAYPGDTVKPGEPLFTLRLLSEYVQDSQSELFKATRDMQLEQEKRQRLEQIGTAIPGARLIEIDQ